MFLICSTARICSFCLFICCSNIAVFSVRSFRYSVVEHGCFLKCCAMELVSESCFVSLLDIYIYISRIEDMIFMSKGFWNLININLEIKFLSDWYRLISEFPLFTITMFILCLILRHIDHYPIYPTPPLGQDMTQGQFFKRSLTGLNSEFSFS